MFIQTQSTLVWKQKNVRKTNILQYLSKLRTTVAFSQRGRIKNWIQRFLFEFQMPSVICGSQKPTSQSDKYCHSNRTGFSPKYEKENTYIILTRDFSLVRPDGDKAVPFFDIKPNEYKHTLSILNLKQTIVQKST